MIFSPDLATLVLAGGKTQTRRRVYYDRDGRRLACTYSAGRDYAVQDRRGGRSLGRIKVLEVERVATFPISLTDAGAEGFDSPAAFETRWIALYGQSPPGECWRIAFELLSAVP